MRHGRTGTAAFRGSTFGRWTSSGGRPLVIALLALIGALVLGAGAGGWWLANLTLIASHQGPRATTAAAAPTGASNQMPDVRGFDLAGAQQVLADSAIPVDAITTHEVPSVAKSGVVVEQTPAFGASEVSRVDLGVAAPVTMPALTGKDQGEAVEALSGFGTAVSVTYAYSKDSVPGTVLASNPRTGRPLGAVASIVIATAGSTLPLSQVRAIEGGCNSNDTASINGHDYSQVVSCSAESDQPETTTWLLSKTVDRFTATVGVADDGEPASRAPYQVLVDGRVAARGTASFGNSTKIDISCSGVIQLTIRVGPTSSRATSVVLGDAVLYGSDQGVSRLAKLK